MGDSRTTLAVQRFLNELAGVTGAAPAEPVVRALLASAVDRLHQLCTTLLFRSDARLTKPPLNLQADELLSSVVKRLLKAMREVRPQTVGQFFALANQHMRWELNDLARRLDSRAEQVEVREWLVGAPAESTSSQLSQTPAAAWMPSRVSRGGARSVRLGADPGDEPAGGRGGTGLFGQDRPAVIGSVCDDAGRKGRRSAGRPGIE